MKSTFIIAAIVLVLVTMPAQAAPSFNVSGRQFFRLCTNPPPDSGAQVEAACELYVSGIADALQLDGRICFGPDMRTSQMYPIALNWLRFRLPNPNVNGNFPASLMIRNGLLFSFPCGAGSQPRVRALTAEQKMESLEKAVAFMQSMKTLFLLFAH
jgi:hypothetical protein